MDRETALQEVKNEPYSAQLQQQDIEYACKKFNLNRDEFDEIMALPTRSFHDYPNSYGIVQFLRKSVNLLRNMDISSL